MRLDTIDWAKEVLEAILSMEEQKMMKCIVLLLTWWRERNRIRGGTGTKAVVHSIETYAAEITKLFIHKTTHAGKK
jgi:hypothetical protein